MKERNASDPDDVYRAYAPPALVEEEPASEAPQSDEASPKLDAVQWVVVAAFFGCVFGLFAWVIFVIFGIATGTFP